MIVPLQRTERPLTTGQSSSPDNRRIADSVVRLPIEPREVPNRRLRNRLILANAAAWIVIAFALAALLF
jgi:hypothetical protein